MSSNRKPASAREARHERVRRRVKGTGERPRLCVFRSCKHIYAQIIDDTSGRSLATVSTLSREVRERAREMKKMEASRVVGERIAELAKAKGITRVAFDRGGFLFHGRIKAVAEAARAGGLGF